MKKNRRSLLEWFIIIPLFIIGLGLVTTDVWLPTISQHLSESYRLSHYTKREIAQNQKQTSRYDMAAIQPLTATALMQSQVYQWTKPHVPVVGEIAIPSVAIHLPIVKGITPYYLSIGAGEMRPEEVMGVHNYSLASHNFNDDRILFSPLRHIKKGDEIYVTNGQKMFTYRVTKKQYVDPTKTEVVEEGTKNIITLVTCSMSGETRLIVTGDLVRQANLTKKDWNTIWDTPMNKG